jgi:hypothetical protein
VLQRSPIRASEWQAVIRWLRKTLRLLLLPVESRGRLTVCHGISPGAGSGMRHSSVQRPGSCGGRAGLEPGEGRTLQRDELGDRATRPAAPDPV